MTKIAIKNGTLYMPDHFVFLAGGPKPEEAAYAGIVEPQHKDEGLPYFFFLSEVPVEELSVEQQDAIADVCSDGVSEHLGIDTDDEWYIFAVRDVPDENHLIHGTGIVREEG